jgi:hypothetical protein
MPLFGALSDDFQIFIKKNENGTPQHSHVAKINKKKRDSTAHSGGQKSSKETGESTEKDG